MILNNDNIEIITVNYNTPDFIVRQYNSVRKFIGDNILYTVIDGSDKRILDRGKDTQKHKDILNNIIENDKNSRIYKLGYNIHHGPGMDYGVRKSNKKFSLILDSDVCIKKYGILNAFEGYFNENMFCMGHVVYVDNLGYNVDTLKGIKYVHPSVMLLDNEKYKNINNNFIKHGAPCIHVMEEVTDDKKIFVKEIRDLLHFKVRGTLDIYGLNIK